MTVPAMPEFGPVLYHYTDIYGVEGIIGGENLRGTDIRFMNDLSEQRFGEGLLDRAFDECGSELQAEAKSGDPLIAAAVDSLTDLHGTTRMFRGDYAPLAMEYFAVCFSESRDQLSQWRAYAREGYCLAFDTAELFTYLRSTPNTGSSADAPLATDMRRVSYGDSGFADLKAFIRGRVLAAATEDIEHGLVGSSSRTGHRNDWGMGVALEAVFHKDPAFAEEREVRVLLGGAADAHTPGRFGMVPRAHVPLQRQLVRSVTVGPNTYADLQATSLESYAVATRWWGGHPTGQFSVLRSEIPYRG
ncbi:DUF2971 domain-containing protein [Gordonia sp. HS-NH1]|uniref:DUF2971 domain-containing protein n=1 Tax=Gordonia sp. HS-NH1 TaxID=1435068 RepID=UPI000AC11F90|nr:DUF2971 domain-containing protein [Gordonia sp. HS-NH1]